MNYKAETTLNEKDSILDMLSTEKALVKLYATVITEGCTKPFRQTVRKCMERQLENQIDVFFCLTENDYFRVETAPEEQRAELKQSYQKVIGELS